MSRMSKFILNRSYYKLKTKKNIDSINNNINNNDNNKDSNQNNQSISSTFESLLININDDTKINDDISIKNKSPKPKIIRRTTSQSELNYNSP